jgi:hypothetical protein
MAKTDYLWKRGNQFYLRLAVPREIQRQGQHFLSSTGKPLAMIVEPLGDSYGQARQESLRRASIYLNIFARIRDGEQITPEQIKTALSLDVEQIRREAAATAAAEVARVQNEMGELFKQEMQRLQQLTPEERQANRRKHVTDDVAKYAPDAIPGTPAWNAIADQLVTERAAALRSAVLKAAGEAAPLGSPTAAKTSETVTQAAEAWFTEMQRDPSAAPRQTTIDGHRLRVRAFVEICRDAPLESVTRAMAADFLAKIAQGKSNRTTNNYATTMAGVFKSATNRGRFTGSNPFADMKRKAGGESYEAFTFDKLQTLFDSFKFEIAPEHTPETALPWVVADCGLHWHEAGGDRAACRLAMSTTKAQTARP